jgi:hypothetical protein
MFEQNPGIIGTVLDFWYRKKAFSQSSSWEAAIPRHQWSIWAEQILAGLEAATAPMLHVAMASQ